MFVLKWLCLFSRTGNSLNKTINKYTKQNYESKSPNTVPTIPPDSHDTMRVHCQRVPTLMSKRNASTIKLTTATTTKEYTHTFTADTSAFDEPIVIKNDISKPTKANKMLLLLNVFIFIFFFFLL